MRRRRGDVVPTAVGRGFTPRPTGRKGSPYVTKVRGSAESPTHHELIRPAAQVDARVALLQGKRGAERRIGAVIPDFEPTAQCIARKSETAEDDRTGRRAGRHELVSKDRVSLREIDELTRFAVAPAHEGEPGAEVWLHGRGLPQRQEADRQVHRQQAETHGLFDLRAILVDELFVHGRHAPAREAETGACLHIFTKGDEPLGANRGAVEIVDVEHPEVAVLVQDVAVDACVLAPYREITEGKIERLLCTRRRLPTEQTAGRRQCQDSDSPLHPRLRRPCCIGGASAGTHRA